MNFQQLRAVREATRQDFNLTEVAATLYTSQPGISRQIRELEEELGVEIFRRAGKRLTGLTPPGEVLLPIVNRLLQEADNLRHAGDEYRNSGRGHLTIAATHSQARYALPAVVKDFRQAFPQVELHLHQGSPKQVADMLIEGVADMGVATEALSDYDELLTLPGYRWTHSVIVPSGHPLQQLGRPLGLADIAEYPVITYERGYTGRAHIDDAFAREGLIPHVVLTAMDADVIKTYVELELGVGIVASVAVDLQRDRTLHAIDAGHLFEINTTRIGLRKGAWLRGYAFAFIEAFVPTLTRDVVEQALRSAP